MKALYLILFALLLSLYNCDKCDKQYPEKASECTDEKLEKAHCCYLTTKRKHKNGSNSEGYTCTKITDDDYNKIEDWVKKYQDSIKADDWESTVKVDCGSKYIIYSLLSIILLFL